MLKKELGNKNNPVSLLKEGKELKILAPKILVSRLPIVLAQVKTRKNSCKLKS